MVSFYIGACQLNGQYTAPKEPPSMVDKHTKWGQTASDILNLEPKNDDINSGRCSAFSP